MTRGRTSASTGNPPATLHSTRVCRNECTEAGGGRCQGNAQCHNSPGSFHCSCPEGYTLGPSGRECRDLDECRSRPGICRDGKCTNMAGSFQCVCRDGFTLTPARDQCIDVNECTRSPGLCGNGTCINLSGSHRCLCHQGFEASPSGDCWDTDECKMTTGLCRNGRCRNLPGSFTCVCQDGFEVMEGGRECRDRDECRDLCLPPGICRNLPGSFLCSCPQGFRLDTAGTKCIDLNECLEDLSLCQNGFCRNTEGGYQCECKPGWRLNYAGRDCEDLREAACYASYSRVSCLAPRPAPSTRQACCCTAGAAWGGTGPGQPIPCQQCPAIDSPEFDLLCPMGLGRARAGQDFNECRMIAGLCEGGDCINTDGSYRCSCPRGLKLDGSESKCVDRDECLEDASLCGEGTCTNINGGFLCSCSPGFAPGLRGTCEDIDECSDSGHQCAFRCHNTPGSYRCICPYGYQLAPDGRHCRDVDECSTEANTCKYRCKNLIGTFACICPPGFRKLGLEDKCEDVDECKERPGVCTKGDCLNTAGSFQCSCHRGYLPSPDGRECRDDRRGACYTAVSPLGSCTRPSSQKELGRPECCCTVGRAWGPRCQECPGRGTLEYQALCQGAGLGPDGRDIDECSAMPELCQHGTCINTMGSYRCICGRGYTPGPGGTR